MRHLLNRVFAVAVAGLALSWPAASFASVQAVSDDVLARTSAAAVEGQVVAATSGWDDEAGTIYTYVTIAVSRAWGLDGVPAQVVLKQLGGVVGDTAFVVGGQAQFEVGEEVLVFLDVRPRDRTLSVAGLERGKWTLSGGGDPAAAANRQLHGNDPTTVVGREYRSRAALDALVALVGSQATAAGAVVAPAVPAPPAGRPGPSFTLLSSTPARWHEADTNTPVNVDTEAGGFAMMPGGGLQQLTNALSAWSAAGSLRLQNGVVRGPRCFSNTEYDGRISVTYDDPCGEISDSSSVLAIGGVYYSATDVRTVNGTAYWKILKGMVVVDNATSKFSSFTTGCYEDMLTHELGHAAGFGHTSARPAIMAPSISSSCFSRATGLPLQSDDLAAVAAVYPGSGQPPPPVAPPGTPGGLHATVSGATVTIAWNAPTSGGAATGYRLYAGTAPGASNVGMFPFSATAVTAASVPMGVYYVRVVATNAAGSSMPSADVAIVVDGSSPPPAAPLNLTGWAGAGGMVSLAWQAPMAGPTPTGYLLLAGHAPGASTYQVPVSGTSLGGSGVPSGTYYVRVVAMNGATMGPACAEVTVVVP
ncbi:MAG: matrixin family metalloprotease [Vicinamibacterales bacterium]